MKRSGMTTVLLLLGLAAAWGEEPPFAQPNPSIGNPDQSLASPSLGDIMGLTQLRHIKLWYAGRAANWPLVSYELERLDDTFTRAGLLYRGIPLDYIKAVRTPLDRIRQAASDQDLRTFQKGYAELTAACNGCHQAGNVGFIRIATPTSSALSDQDFKPAKRP